MPRWRRVLFALARNARPPTEFFGNPANEVVELGAQTRSVALGSAGRAQSSAREFALGAYCPSRRIVLCTRAAPLPPNPPAPRSDWHGIQEVSHERASVEVRELTHPARRTRYSLGVIILVRVLAAIASLPSFARIFALSRCMCQERRAMVSCTPSFAWRGRASSAPAPTPSAGLADAGKLKTSAYAGGPSRRRRSRARALLVANLSRPTIWSSSRSPRATASRHHPRQSRRCVAAQVEIHAGPHRVKPH
jgi:hypothetical protein